ncbi:MAG TPA: IS110 family transposase [Candidatus Limnocylindria bacterium]|nr:IS110 family transposase [Candidatus Dormibacteraeota bacterium]HYS28654.1 IS110 family transposase [Candidatus Limnocylindria bacterium]
MIFVGIDWSEEQHEVEVMAASGQRLRSLRIAHGVAGLAKLQETILEFASEPSEVVVGVEADHGLLVNALAGSGYQVYPINPLTAARYRDRHSLAGNKSDRRDAVMLANVVRTDRHLLRPLAGDSEAALEIRARARAHLRAIRLRSQLRNQLRSLLLEFYPAVLPLLAADDIRDALAVLAVAPTPMRGRGLSLSQLESTLRRHGRQRNVAARAQAIQAQLRAPHLDLQRPRLIAAHGDEVASLTRVLLQVRQELAQLEAQMAAAFRGHPDAQILRSCTGLADILGARVLGESGDDPTRYADATARRNYSGNPPVTRASGKKREVTRRVARNRRLADATFCWAESAVRHSPGAGELYSRLRRRGQAHNQAIRVIANKLVGQLHACLRDRTLYDEQRAWPTELSQRAA